MVIKQFNTDGIVYCQGCKSDLGAAVCVSFFLFEFIFTHFVVEFQPLKLLD